MTSKLRRSFLTLFALAVLAVLAACGIAIRNHLHEASLIETLREGNDDDARRDAAWELSEMGSTKAMPVLAELLGRINAEELKKPPESEYRSSDPMRLWIARALLRFGDAGVDALIGAAKETQTQWVYLPESLDGDEWTGETWEKAEFYPPGWLYSVALELGPDAGALAPVLFRSAVEASLTEVDEDRLLPSSHDEFVGLGEAALQEIARALDRGGADRRLAIELVGEFRRVPDALWLEVVRDLGDPDPETWRTALFSLRKWCESFSEHRVFSDEVGLAVWPHLLRILRSDVASLGDVESAGEVIKQVAWVLGSVRHEAPEVLPLLADRVIDLRFTNRPQWVVVSALASRDPSGETAVPQLIEKARSSDPYEAAVIFQALGRWGSLSPELLALARPFLDPDDPRLAVSAMAWLESYGSAAKALEPELLELFRQYEDDSPFRWHIAVCLAAVGSTSQEMRDFLIRETEAPPSLGPLSLGRAYVSLADSDPIFASRFAEHLLSTDSYDPALWRLKPLPREFFELATERLASADDEVAGRAVRVLKRTSSLDRISRREWLRLARHDDFEVREAAVSALLEVDANAPLRPGILDDALELLECYSAREKAATLLGQFDPGRPETVGALRSLLMDCPRKFVSLRRSHCGSSGSSNGPSRRCSTSSGRRMESTVTAFCIASQNWGRKRRSFFPRFLVPFVLATQTIARELPASSKRSVPPPARPSPSSSARSATARGTSARRSSARCDRSAVAQGGGGHERRFSKTALGSRHFVGHARRARRSRCRAARSLPRDAAPRRPSGGDSSSRRDAAWALADLGSEAAIPILAKELRTFDVEERSSPPVWIVRALVRLGEPGVAALVEQARKSSWKFEASLGWLARSARELGPEGAALAPALIDSLSTESREDARDPPELTALEALGDAAIPAVENAMKRGGAYRRVAIDWMANRKWSRKEIPASFLSAIVLDDDDVSVRAHAIDLLPVLELSDLKLSAGSGQAAAEALVRRLDDAELRDFARTRRADHVDEVASALASLSPPAPAVLEPLIACLVDAREPSEVHWEVLAALRRHDSSGRIAIPLLSARARATLNDSLAAEIVSGFEWWGDSDVSRQSFGEIVRCLDAERPECSLAVVDTLAAFDSVPSGVEPPLLALFDASEDDVLEDGALEDGAKVRVRTAACLAKIGSREPRILAFLDRDLPGETIRTTRCQFSLTARSSILTRSSLRD